MDLDEFQKVSLRKITEQVNNQIEEFEVVYGVQLSDHSVDRHFRLTYFAVQYCISEWIIQTVYNAIPQERIK
jgi:hypothetical protein